MSKVKIKRSILARLISGPTFMAKKGPSGWMVILGIVIALALVIMTAIAPWISPHDPNAINVGPIRAPPSSQFPMGTNHLGQDMLSRILWGGSVMLQISALSVLVCFLIGVPLGLFSSYVGGIFDRACSLVIDAIYAFPGLVIAIAIAAVLGPGVVNMALSIAVVYIPSYFRVVRSQVLSIKELTYVEAARGAGAKWYTILFRYIFPNVIPSVVVIATINFADAVLTAAGLTFIGLGVTKDIPDWGWDLTDGRALLPSGTWWVITFPGLMVVLLALGFTLVGEGLSELLNPKLQR
ncbi:MAG: ABC transporter permease [Candidatus Bathyarchaeota archaeon]|nr:ABC transporter permease [Candidatus Bathyarchaeota archaeon]